MFFCVRNSIEFTCFQIPLGKKCFTFNRIFLRTKILIFPRSSSASNETCFSLYLWKGKFFIQLFWLLGFTVVAKKNTFSAEFSLPWKKQPEKNSKKKKKTGKTTSSWKCAILLTFLPKKVTCNILKN